MTTLKIDMKLFKEDCLASRAHMAATDTVSDVMHRCNVQDGDRDWYLGEVEALEYTADDLSANLNVAARRCQQFGASRKQVSYLVSLAEKSGRSLKMFETSALTKEQASNLINDLLVEG